VNPGDPAVGVHPTATDYSIPVVELAGEAQARGLRSIYLPEHTHVPVGSQQIAPGWVMPDRYKRVLDPFISSAYIAATTNLEVGTGVALVAQHDAIALAKAVATLDYLSGGRMVLGVGFGYNRPEAADHGFAPERRAAVVEETVALMRAVWSHDEAGFEGTFRHLSPSWSWPKPARPGGVPVLLGSRATDRNIERIVQWADGWIPMGAGADVDEIADDLAEIRRRWAAEGREGGPRVCYFFQPDTTQRMARQISRSRELGIQTMQVFLEDRSRDDVLPILDRVAESIEMAGR
jgi:probable F420-dependent oxidoreductase